jgi:uncharacterized cupin superfamily protein
VTPSILRHPAAPTAPVEEYRLSPERILEGDPLQSVWIEYQDPSGAFVVGTWASEPGTWRIRYTEHEYCRMLAGRCVIADEAGVEVAVGPGDEFTIPAGFVGTWRVLEAARKRFVIYEPVARTE